MTKKLKKKFKLCGTCFCLIASIFLCGKISVYGTEERLTEEEVKSQVKEIVKEDMDGEISANSIVTYDIDKLYQLIYMDFIINDYIDGVPFREIIEKEQVKNAKNNDDFLYWILPYKNIYEENCYVILGEKSKKIEIIMRVTNIESNNSFDLSEEKYSKIMDSEIKEVFFISLTIYNFDIVYVTLENGKEYIIPSFNNANETTYNYIHEQVYEIDSFFVKMYNFYIEPTKNELKKYAKADLYGEVSARILRKKTLKYRNIEEIRIAEKLKDILPVMVISIIFIAVVEKKLKKKKIKQKKV